MPPTPRPTLVVLVVDDNHDPADSMAAYLGLHGHQATAVYSGEDALRQALAQPPDAVLLDVSMPGMDGVELTEQLLARAARRPFLIAITGLTDDADRWRTRGAGVDVYLTKPINPALVLDMLERMTSLLHPAPSAG